VATAELVTDTEPADLPEDGWELAGIADGAAGRRLLRALVRDGEVIGREPIAAARARHRAAIEELPGYARQLSRGYPAIPTVFEPERD
jgi:nicotinate phosphoribosyltransferase